MTHTGFDTETERGRAVLLCTPTRSLFFPEDFDHAAKWLADFEEDRRRPTFIAWNVSFDAQALLRLLPRDKRTREELVRLGLTTRATFGTWRVRFIPHKLFEGSDKERGLRFAVFDGFPFFGMGLDAAAKKWLDAGKQELPPEVKRFLLRGRMGQAIQKGHGPVIETYCRRDALLAQRLGEKLGDSCAAAGLDFSRPVSPASLARKRWGSKMAGQFAVEDEAFAQPAFFGGRIEVLTRGELPPGTKRWDVRSAYPSVMRGFFSPRATGRIEGEALREDAVYAVADVWLDLAPGFASYPVPIRLPEGLVYPWGSFDARVDLHTLRALLDAPAGMVKTLAVRRLVQWTPISDERPFAPMAELYERRKADPAASLALKLMLNASYGLLAEHVPLWVEARDMADAKFLGGRWWSHIEKEGAGQSYVLAAHVTGATRAKVWRETLDAEPFAFMTDGVLARGSPTGRAGEALGDWSYEGEGRALVVGSGLYAVENATGTWTTKTRGWSRLPPLRELLRKVNAGSMVALSDIRAQSLRQFAVSPRARWLATNELRELPRVLDLNFDRKRQWTRRLRGRDFLGKCWTSTARGVIGTAAVS